MAEKSKAATVTLLCCVSSDGAATWPQTVARDDAAVETCEPDSLMKKLDEFKEQPVCVLADQNSYDAAASACRTASSDDRCVLGAIRVANPTTALVEVDQALKQARSQAAATFSRHNAGVPKAPYGVPWRPLLKDALQTRPSAQVAAEERQRAAEQQRAAEEQRHQEAPCTHPAPVPAPSAGPTDDDDAPESQTQRRRWTLC